MKNLMNFRLDARDHERLKRVAYWVPGETMSKIIRRAIEVELDYREDENGGLFKAIPEKAGV